MAAAGLGLDHKPQTLNPEIQGPAQGTGGSGSGSGMGTGAWGCRGVGARCTHHGYAR